MGAKSRRKGKVFERLIRQFFEADRAFDIVTHAHVGESESDIVVDLSTRRLIRFVIECKNERETRLTPWWRQAVEQQEEHDDQAWPVLIHKRRGETEAGDQWVTMDLDTFARLLEHVAWEIREPWE